MDPKDGALEEQRGRLYRNYFFELKMNHHFCFPTQRMSKIPLRAAYYMIIVVDRIFFTLYSFIDEEEMVAWPANDNYYLLYVYLFGYGSVLVDRQVTNCSAGRVIIKATFCRLRSFSPRPLWLYQSIIIIFVSKTSLRETLAHSFTFLWVRDWPVEVVVWNAEQGERKWLHHQSGWRRRKGEGKDDSANATIWSTSRIYYLQNTIPRP